MVNIIVNINNKLIANVNDDKVHLLTIDLAEMCEILNIVSRKKYPIPAGLTDTLLSILSLHYKKPYYVRYDGVPDDVGGYVLYTLEQFVLYEEREEEIDKILYSLNKILNYDPHSAVNKSIENIMKKWKPNELESWKEDQFEKFMKRNNFMQ